MNGDTKKHTRALVIMAAVILLNAILAINFVSAAGSALALLFNSRNIYALGGVELLLVLLTYVISTHQSVPLPPPPRAPMRQS
ncbi:MAG: hypothetical protein R3E50_04485 [Halioglobus sp.]